MEAAGAYNASRVVDVHFRAGGRDASRFSHSLAILFSLCIHSSLHHTRQLFFSFFFFFFLFQINCLFPAECFVFSRPASAGKHFSSLNRNGALPSLRLSPAIVTFSLHRGCDLSSFSVRSERVTCDIYLSWLNLERSFDVTRPDAVQLAIFT